MQNSVLEKTFANLKLYAFGSLSSEKAQKSVKIATLDLGANIDLYMSPEGFQKMASIAPCPVWFMKAGFEEKKAMFVSSFEEETLQFADAEGVQRTVHLRYPVGTMRGEAM